MEYDYNLAAEKYNPKIIEKEIEYLFIAESPPVSENDLEPRYFYNDHLEKYDFLFKYLASVFESLHPALFRSARSKEDRLKCLQKLGVFLIDACDYPINQIPVNKRNKLIVKDYALLKKRIDELVTNKTNIILIKQNIYNLLKDRLCQDGYHVINKVDKCLPFPSNGNQGKFKRELKDILGLSKPC
jgi:hypothetical protein